MFRVLLSTKGALQYITIRTSYKHLHLRLAVLENDLQANRETKKYLSGLK